MENYIERTSGGARIFSEGVHTPNIFFSASHITLSGVLSGCTLWGFRSRNFVASSFSKRAAMSPLFLFIFHNSITKLTPNYNKNLVHLPKKKGYCLQFFFSRNLSKRTGQGVPTFRIHRIELAQFIRKTGPKNRTNYTMPCL